MDANNEHVDQLTTITKAKGFLGREFLTWLWYTAETTTEKLQAVGREAGEELSFDLWVDDRIVLDGNSGMAHQHVMKGGDPSRSREAEAALATGKTVREMKIGLNVKGVGEFTAVLNSEDLNPRSLRLPSPESGEGVAKPSDMPIVTRLKYMDTFLAVLDGLFARFLALRVDEDWEQTGLAEMRAWIKKKQESGVFH